MERPIKFRGRRVDNGEFVYGDLLHMTGERFGIIFDKRIAATEVAPETVTQLVGYDSNGREVYEGDKLANDQGDEFTAELFDGVITDDGFAHIIPVEILTLKEIMP